MRRICLNKRKLFDGHETNVGIRIYSMAITDLQPKARGNWEWEHIVNEGCDHTGEQLRTLCKEGRVKEALGNLHLINQLGIGLDSNTYTHLLQGCIDMKALTGGKRVHAHMLNSGFEIDVFSMNNLVNMYARCGSVTDARQVFDRMPERNVVSWTAMITGYAQQGHSEEALNLFYQMSMSGTTSNQFTFAIVIRACTSLAAVKSGKQVHANIIKSGFENNVFVGSALGDMYAKSGSIEDALEVFENMPNRDVVSWNAMIAGYIQNEHHEKALQLFCEMQYVGMKPNQFTFASVLKACATLSLEQVHACIIKYGIDSDIIVGSALVDMYAKCGNIGDARQVFDKMPERDVVSWSAMVAGYAQDGDGEEALKLFCQSQRAALKPDQYTFASGLKACAILAALEQGKQVHVQIIKANVHLDVFVASALVDMYAKCGSIENAQKVFDKMHKRDEVAWNGMITGYAQNEHGEEALKLFRQMQQSDIEQDHFAFIGVLKACASLLALEQGKQVHSHITKSGLELDVSVGNALLDMYAKCREINDSRKLFDDMVNPDAVSWSAMIGGYAQNEHGEEALKLSRQMQEAGVKSSEFSFASALKACASLAALEQGKQFHGHIIKTEFESDVFVGSALIDMYAKCGNIEDAGKAFCKIPERNVVSWNAMIGGYAQHGHGKDAIQLFEDMQQAGMHPNDITFVGVLSACSHVGLVDESHYYFDSMSQNYGITPRLEHYACVVDLLGRAGRLDEAENFIKEMPVKPGVVVWRTLLAACRIHGNVELGKQAARCALELEPQDDATYVLLSNIYAAAGKWDDVSQVRNMMKNRGVKKEPGTSWIEIKNKVHAFVVSDRSHPQMEEIFALLERLTEQIKGAGYVPDTNFVLYDVEQEKKEHSLCHHSEKLAVAFGLINTCPGAPIRVIKNLRACGDCHTAIKFISQIVKREIVVRDASRFHHFKDGLCSCRDYW
eukprot:Gb_10157 [translate_table: standard]